MCCHIPTPIDACRRLIPADTMKAFDEQAMVYRTPHSERIHGSAAGCPAFTPRNAVIGSVVTCAQCQSTNCELYRKAGHLVNLVQETTMTPSNSES